MVSNNTLLVKTKLSSPVLENRNKRVVASVTGAKRRQLTETAVRYSKVAMAVVHLLHELPNVRSCARLFLETRSPVLANCFSVEMKSFIYCSLFLYQTHSQPAALLRRHAKRHSFVC